MPVYLYDPASRLLTRRGRAPIVPQGFDDGFVLGVTKPGPGNTGANPAFPLRPYTGPLVIDGTLDPSAPLVLSNVRFTRPITIRSGYVDILNFEATNSDGIEPGFETALINTSSKGVLGVRLERGTFDPGVAGAHWYLNAVTGHHTTLVRCRARRVVDFVGSFNVHAPEVDTAVLGCYLEWLAYWNADAPGKVHPSDTRTHNDGIQHQGGSGLRVEGNYLRGLVFHPDGVTVPSDQGTVWERYAHQGVLTQQNVQKGTAISPVVVHNWIEGFQHAMVFKTAASGGTGYDATVEGNRLDDRRRYYGTSADLYGVPGGRPFTIRLDRATTVNGVQYDYPLPAVANAGSAGAATSVEYAVDGDNLYEADPLLTLAPARRGQPITVRRDNFLGG